MSGFQGYELCSFISKNPSILTHSLKKTLVPSVEAIRKIVYDQKDFILVLHRCGWILPKYKRIMENVVFLESCGILGTHLSLLLKLHPRLFVAQRSTIENNVSRAVDLGFRENSRMLVHAIHTLSCLSDKTFERKLKLINCFGFSKDEGLQMFKRTPTLFRTSEKKLKVGMKFFLHTVMLPKSVLIHQPKILMYSMEDRVLPRYKVFQLLKSKNLCKKVPSYIHVLCLSEEMFLDNPEKVKVKPSPIKKKKVGRDMDQYKNYSYACETLLSLMVDKKQRGRTAILSLKKSSSELFDLLTQFAAGIAGTGLAFLLSVMGNIACGRATFCASNFFNTGFGLGLVCLSGAVNKLRVTILSISKNTGKLGLKEEKMMQKLDESIRDIYYTAAALLAVVMLRFA
ncbi:nucleolar protein 12 [Vigna unguiculata]|uniref:Nucleolar protein 12 n=2 Tax=Vigna unguiculata TaxID=3917 RepID=A0A4D6LIS6_VIGUN|nr:nucleolar protein 12 [Vigna unguiculata]